MSEKIIKMDEHVNKKDLDLILEVNKKAIEIETEVAEQNEEVIDGLHTIKERQERIDEQLQKLSDQSENINRELFKIQVLWVTGLLSIIIQIISVFFKK